LFLAGIAAHRFQMRHMHTHMFSFTSFDDQRFLDDTPCGFLLIWSPLLFLRARCLRHARTQLVGTTRVRVLVALIHKYEYNNTFFHLFRRLRPDLPRLWTMSGNQQHQPDLFHLMSALASAPPPLHIIRSHTSAISALFISSDNERIFSGDISGLVVITSTRSLRSMASWKAHTDGLLGIEEWGRRVITSVCGSLFRTPMHP
jgi:hypothetical protein